MEKTLPIIHEVRILNVCTRKTLGIEHTFLDIPAKSLRWDSKRHRRYFLQASKHFIKCDVRYFRFFHSKLILNVALY